MRLRKLMCRRTGIDRYRRFLGVCWAQPVLWGAPVDLSAAMVSSGHAVVYRQGTLLPPLIPFVASATCYVISRVHEDLHPVQYVQHTLAEQQCGCATLYIPFVAQAL